MATFHFDLVSPEKLAFSGEVDQVDIPGVEGDFGVLAGHAPVVAAIRPGILTVTIGGTHEKIIVLGGLAASGWVVVVDRLPPDESESQPALSGNKTPAPPLPKQRSDDRARQPVTAAAMNPSRSLRRREWAR